AHMHKWVSIFNDSVAPVMGGGLIVQRLMMPKMGKEPDEVRIAEAIPKARHCLEVYDGALAGKDWLVGDAISLADLFAIPMFAYLPMIPEGDELLKGLPNLMRWYDANAARESFKNTVADVDM
ncbi:MAG: glutathione S-transferase family protein, partial [Rhodospirillales bacterium]